MVLLCDGRLVCGCADPYGRRVLGDARTTSVSAVWTGETASALRQDLNGGGSKFCGDCPLKLPLTKDQQPPQRDLTVSSLPSRLYIETTAACNISCEQACCAPETGITRTRQAGMLDFELFKRVVDEAGPSLGRIDFFNYGEAFLHKRAVEMCEYIKSRFPHIYLYTSTNGLAFSEEQVRRLIRSGIDEVTFSIDGATAESYVKYRRRGDFEKAIAEPSLCRRREARRRARRAVPQLALHPLHAQRQRPGDAAGAGNGALDRRRPSVLGADGSPGESVLATVPAGAPTTWPASVTRSGTTTIWATPSRAPHPRAEIDVRGPVPLPGLPIVARHGRPLTLRARVRNASTRPFPAQATYGRRLVRLGAQLCAADGSLMNRDYERAWLPASLEPGARADVPITITAPAEPGRYALKFDLVSEGIDWFEACGSPTTTKTLVVI